MSEKILLEIEAIYEDGVFKPITPPDLQAHQRVRLQVEVEAQERHIVKLYGVLAPYWEG